MDKKVFAYTERYSDIPDAIKDRIRKYYILSAMVASCFIIVAIIGLGMSLKFLLTGLFVSVALIVAGQVSKRRILDHGFVTYIGTCIREPKVMGFGNSKNFQYLIDCDDKVIKLSATKGNEEIPPGHKVLIYAPYDVKEYTKEGYLTLSSFYTYEVI